MKILLAEDQSTWIELFKPQLEKLGEVVVARNGVAARRALHNHDDFDIIVSDHYMPRSMGLKPRLMHLLKQEQF